MELFHVMNHGVEGRPLFLDGSDYARFVHDLFEFNDTQSIDNTRHRLPDQNTDLRGPYFGREKQKLVALHGWCLMKDHYHLLLSEAVEGGLTRFLMKLNVGYAKYVNERYGRHGALFRGRTKKVHIGREAHFLYILHYIHLNPLDYLAGAQEWRVRSKGSIRNPGKALEYLDSYRWSSYLDYCGKRNFPSLLDRTPVEDAPGGYIASLRQYLADAEAGGDILTTYALE